MGGKLYLLARRGMRWKLEITQPPVFILHITALPKTTSLNSEMISKFYVITFLATIMW